MPNPFSFLRIAMLFAIAMSFVQTAHSSPASETSHATPSAGGGRFVFAMHADYSGEQVSYKGTCYSVTESGLEPTWKINDCYACHGNLLLSEDGKYLVRIAPSMAEAIKHSDDLGPMPCLRIYENGKLARAYKLSELVKDLSKVVRGPEFLVGWQNDMKLRGNILKIQTIDGEELSIDLTQK